MAAMSCTWPWCLLLVALPTRFATKSESFFEDEPNSMAWGSSLLQSQKTLKQVHLEPSSASMETSWRCTGDMHNRSCLFKNLYYGLTSSGSAEFVAVVSQGRTMDINSTGMLLSDRFSYLWTPRVQEFPNSSELNSYMASKHLLAQPGLSLHFVPLFHENIGHALFDGLYPAYVGLHRLGLQHEDFRPVVGVPENCFDSAVRSGIAVVEGKLKPGEIVDAYLPHPHYNKTLQPSKVEIIQVMEKSSPSSITSDKMTLCSFEEGRDSSAVDMSKQLVSAGEAGQAECCNACAQTFGCTRGVIYGDTCYLKSSCPEELHDVCDHAKEGALLCRFNEPDVVVRQISRAGATGLKEEQTIPYTWVVGREILRCMSEGIYETFGQSRSMTRLFEMDRDIASNPDVLFHFEEIAIGSGGAGNLLADGSGAIGGSSAPFNAMASFRDRMLEAYGLPVEHGTFSDDSSKPLDIMIVSNRRFDSNDTNNLATVIEHVKRPGEVHAEIIDWGDIGAAEPKNRFREHLKRVQRADVYVSSVGTALQYVPFMKDHRVFVAQGTIWQTNDQVIPTFLEQQLAGGGTPYLRTLYADPGAVLRTGVLKSIGDEGWRAMVNDTVLSGLLHKAEALVRQGFQIPVPIEENLSEAGKVLVELCMRDPATCQLMQADRNGGWVTADDAGGDPAKWQCTRLLWPECLVYEVGAWRSECSLNRTLLRQLRREHGLFAYGAPEI